MYAEGLHHFTNIPLVICGMLIFFTVFLGILVWTYKPKATYLEAANLPLGDEDLTHEKR